MALVPLHFERRLRKTKTRLSSAPSATAGLCGKHRHGYAAFSNSAMASRMTCTSSGSVTSVSVGVLQRSLSRSSFIGDPPAPPQMVNLDMDVVSRPLLGADMDVVSRPGLDVVSRPPWTLFRVRDSVFSASDLDRAKLGCR